MGYSLYGFLGFFFKHDITYFSSSRRVEGLRVSKSISISSGFELRKDASLVWMMCTTLPSLSPAHTKFTIINQQFEQNHPSLLASKKVKQATQHFLPKLANFSVTFSMRAHFIVSCCWFFWWVPKVVCDYSQANQRCAKNAHRLCLPRLSAHQGKWHPVK